MTESEWLGCEDPEPMMESLQGGVSERKLRLLSVACIRLARSGLLAIPSIQEAIKVGEGIADGTGRWWQRWWSMKNLVDTPVDRGSRSQVLLGLALTAIKFGRYSKVEAGIVVYGAASVCEEPIRVVQGQGAKLIHDIIGNPFRPISVNPGWLAPTVLALAQAAYDERFMPEGKLDPDRLAVLSDALEEAGCDDAGILDHLRAAGPHVRGCWATDILLGKK